MINIIISNIPIAEKHYLMTCSPVITFDENNNPEKFVALAPGQKYINIYYNILSNLRQDYKEYHFPDYLINPDGEKSIMCISEHSLKTDIILNKKYYVYHDIIRAASFNPQTSYELRYYPEQPDAEKLEKHRSIGKTIGKIESLLPGVEENLQQQMKLLITELENKLKEL